MPGTRLPLLALLHLLKMMTTGDEEVASSQEFLDTDQLHTLILVLHSPPPRSLPSYLQVQILGELALP